MGKFHETQFTAPEAVFGIRKIDDSIAAFASALRDRLDRVRDLHPDASPAIREVCTALEKELYPELRRMLRDSLTEVIAVSGSQSTRVLPEQPPADLAPLRQRSKVIAEHSVSAPVYRHGSSYR